jgi:hypothetical protein
MAQESVITRTVNLNGGGVTIGGVSEKILTDSVETFKKAIPANTTNGRVVKPRVTLDNCKALGIMASKDCTVKTNSTSSPQETLTLKANKMLHWMYGDPDANKFLADDVTDWYVTTGGEDTLLQILNGEDATPVLTE